MLTAKLTSAPAEKSKCLQDSSLTLLDAPADLLLPCSGRAGHDACERLLVLGHRGWAVCALQAKHGWQVVQRVDRQVCRGVRTLAASLRTLSF